MKICRAVVNAIIDHAKRDVPIEACGYLAGKDDEITKHYELPNVDQSHDHFAFDPKDQFLTLRDARGRGLDLLAVYHSHPVTPARPSPEDLRLAFDPALSYVIVSLCQDQPQVRSFIIRDAQPSEQPLEVIEDE